MRTRTAGIVGAVLVLFAGVAGAEVPAAFEPGEGLSLELRYLGMRAGVMELSVSQGSLDAAATWPLTMRLETRGLADKLFGVRETFVSHLVPATGACMGHDLDATMDGVPERERVRYDGTTARVWRERAGAAQEFTRDALPGAMDGLAALYRVRSLPLDSSFTVPIFTGRNSWLLEGRVTGRERVSVEAGEFDAIVVRLRTHFDGKFASDRELTVWLSADERRLPLKLEAPFMIGAIKGELTGWHSGPIAAK